jgi:uncharacterized membrane protein YukC
MAVIETEEGFTGDVTGEILINLSDSISKEKSCMKFPFTSQST